MYDVFIAHESIDKHVASAICNRLETNRIRCYLESRDRDIESNPEDNWKQALGSVRVAIIVFSEASSQSEDVLKQVELAIQQGVQLLPFKVDDSDVTGGMSFYLSTTHWITMMNDNLEEHIGLLLERLEGMMLANQGFLKEEERDKDQQVVALDDTGHSLHERMIREKKRNIVFSSGVVLAAVICVVVIALSLTIVTVVQQIQNNNGTLDDETGQIVDVEENVTNEEDELQALVGMDVDEVYNELRDQGYRVQVDYLINDDEDSGTVLKLVETLGDSSTEKGLITLSVSRRSGDTDDENLSVDLRNTIVPDLSGKSEIFGVTALLNLRLEHEIIYEYSSEIDAGIIISNSKVNEKVASKEVIVLTVSKGKEDE